VCARSQIVAKRDEMAERGACLPSLGWLRRACPREILG